MLIIAIRNYRCRSASQSLATVDHGMLPLALVHRTNHDDKTLGGFVLATK